MLPRSSVVSMKTTDIKLPQSPGDSFKLHLPHHKLTHFKLSFRNAKMFLFFSFYALPAVNNREQK